MKKIPAILTAIIAMITVFSTLSGAVETSIKGTIYANWMMDQSKGAKGANAHTIDRAYFGAESKLTDYTFMRITFDIRPERFFTSATKVIDSGGDTVSVPALSAYGGYPIILKYAYFDWKIKPIAQYFRVRLGLQPTAYLSYVETSWMRRYIAKMITDQNGWISTSDFGTSAIATFGPQGKLGEAELSVLNGTKYSDVTENNKNKDLNLAARIVPLFNNADFDQTSLFAQFYTGTQNVAITAPVTASDWKRQIISVGGKLAYQKWIDADFDLNFQTLGQGVGKAETKQKGLSFWGNLYLNGLVPSSSLFRTLILFGRVDKYDPNTKIDKDGTTLAIAGLECAPAKGIRGAIGFKQTSFQKDGINPTKFIFVNTELKF
ncbi:MAG TPA: hypothetical protein DEO84_08885 [candidate division Zixibacteria bacterium]|nr:hypothetical protein [candidate division Zixibacteria bacterium]